MNPITAAKNNKHNGKAHSTEQEIQTGHIISHTHWDREWRYPLWHTRADLVRLMDEVVDVLERGIYPAFLCDGQVVMVEDYLEIRPERRERIQALVRAGKLQIGPWYTLPDTHPIELECFVRNLLRGRKVGDALGGWMEIGYFSFGWGLPAQFPQLLRGFGIEAAITSKFIDPRRCPRSEFIWRAPDGSTVLATRLGHNARAGFYFGAHLSIVHGRAYAGNDYAWTPGDGRIPFHHADPKRCFNDYFLLESPTSYHREMINPAMLDTVWGLSEQSNSATHRHVMDGSDSSAPQPMLPEIINCFNSIDPARQLQHSSLPVYIQHLRRELAGMELQIVEGEFRDGPATACSANALATRLYLKQLNTRATLELLHVAEPLAVLARLHGAEYPGRLLEKAWEYLLLSHCHDSINGVTQDKTANDVEYRLNQALELAGVVRDQALAFMVRNFDLSVYPQGTPLLLVYNPLPHARSCILEAALDFPWAEEVDRFHLEDETGQRLDVQLINKERWVYPVVELHQRPMPFEAERHRFVFATDEIPPMGWRVYRAIPDNYQNRKVICWTATHAEPRSLSTAGARIENEFIVVKANPNGTFNLTDKQVGFTYSGLGVFEDSGDIGDYWRRVEPTPNETVYSTGGVARISIATDGPLLSEMQIETNLDLPQTSRSDGRGRSAERKPLPVRMVLAIRKGSPLVEIRVELDNQHANHRLRMLFPTGLRSAEKVDVGSHGYIESRPFRIESLEGAGLVFADMQTQPMQQFIDLSDKEQGLAFLHEGLTEYQVFDDEMRTVALTLLRSVRNEVCTEGRNVGSFPDQSGGQCFGSHTYRLGLMPHAGNWNQADVPQTALSFLVSPQLIQTTGSTGNIPTAAPGFSIQPSCVRVLAIKRAEEGGNMVVRLCNLSAEMVSCGLQTPFTPTHAWHVNLAEQRENTLPFDGKAVHVDMLPWQITTIELEFAGETYQICRP